MDEIFKCHVTPDLPNEAVKSVTNWKSESKFNNAFFRVIEQTSEAICKNCGDAGFVMVSFTRAGPFQDVPNHRVGETLTWFEGNQECGKGWYIITNTISYKCHHCESSVREFHERPRLDLI